MNKSMRDLFKGLAAFLMAACLCSRAQEPTPATVANATTHVDGPATVTVSVSVTPDGEAKPAEAKPAESEQRIPVVAVAKPTRGGKVTEEEASTVWNLLETAIPEENYEVASRAALRQLCAEIGVPSESLGNYDFSKATDEVKEKLAAYRDVDYLLACDVSSLTDRSKATLEYEGKLKENRNVLLGRETTYEVKGKEKVEIDTRTEYVCSVRLIDLKKGTVVRGRRGNISAGSLTELADKMEYHLARILTDSKQSSLSALLLPNIQVANAPIYLGEFANTTLESALLAQGVRLQNLLSVKKILANNHLDELSELEPAMFVKVGKLLSVKTLMQLTINRFEVTAQQRNIAASGRTVVLYSGAIGGNLRVVSAQTGELLASIPFEQKFNPLRPTAQTRSWELEDYGKYYLGFTLQEMVIPQLLQRMDQL